MSATFDVVCTKHKTAVWLGQRDYIYKTDETLGQLQKFLFEHQYCPLRFGEGQLLEIKFGEYAYVEGTFDED